jgi:hypothetical protein
VRPLVRALALGALALLAACSTTRLIYEHADLFLRWQAERYLDVHGAQSEALDAGIARFLAWHRAVALPRYAAIARQADVRFGRGLSRADLVWGYDAFQNELKAAMRAAAEQTAPLLDQLSPGQIEHLRARFDEDNRRFAKEQLEGDREERRRRRVKRDVERLEDWLGDLSDAQIEQVRRYSARAPLVDEMRDRERRRLQDAFLATLRAHRAERLLADLAANWDRDREPAFVAAHRANVDALFDMLLAIDRMLSPEQRRYAHERLRAFAADFERLAKQ